MKFLSHVTTEGQIESTATGFKFPDSTTQSTAAIPLSVEDTPPSEASPPATSIENVSTLVFEGASVELVSAGKAKVVIPGGGSALTVKEEDGSPSVANVTELRFSGATVEEVSAGIARVTVAAGGGTSPVLGTDSFTATAAQTDFTLSNAPLADGIVYVSRDGVVARGADWSVTGSTVTFGAGLDAGTEVQVTYWRTAPSGATPGGEGATATEGQTVFPLAQTISSALVVALNGVVQHSTSWAITGGGTALTLTAGAEAGADVWISYLY